MASRLFHIPDAKKALQQLSHDLPSCNKLKKIQRIKLIGKSTTIFILFIFFLNSNIFQFMVSGNWWVNLFKKGIAT
jgi:hypothetical protein